MSEILQYKGFRARTDYREDDKIIYGRLIDIDDLIDFYTDNPEEVENEFHKAVDDYIEFRSMIENDHS